MSAAIAFALLLPLGALATWPESEILLHDLVRGGNLQAADSLARADAEAYFSYPRRYPHGYARTSMAFITGRFDSVLADAGRGRAIVQLERGSDAVFGALVEFNRPRIQEGIQSLYGASEEGDILRLLYKCLILFGKADVEVPPILRYSDAADSGYLVSYALRPVQADVNILVLRHLADHGSGRYGRELSEVLFFLIKRDPFLFGIGLGGGPFWMNEAGQTSPPAFNPSYLFDFRFQRGYIMTRLGRSSLALDGCYLAYLSERLALAPYAGVGHYSAKKGFHGRSFWGPDAGINLDWNFRIFQPPRGRLNVFLRINAGAMVDPKAIPEDWLTGTMLYANLGLGLNLDIFSRFTPYVKHGRIKYHRDRNWW